MREDRVVVDISSDEDEAESSPSGWESHGEEIAWLSELLHGPKPYDPEEVIIVDEINTKSKSRSNPDPAAVSCVDDDGDDCVILEGDPDKGSTNMAAVNDDDSNGSDDDAVVVVGEKGQIACRDYPHPRHSCAKYSFGSTPHEKHCEMCHCYVCDLPAPCIYWYNGVSNIDHCHATDTSDRWTEERKKFRIGKNTAPQIPNPTNTSLSLKPPQAPLRNIIRLSTTTSSSLPQNPGFTTPSIIRACTSSNRPGISVSRIRPPSHPLCRSPFQPRVRSGGEQLLQCVHNNNARGRHPAVGPTTVLKQARDFLFEAQTAQNPVSPPVGPTRILKRTRDFRFEAQTAQNPVSPPVGPTPVPKRPRLHNIQNLNSFSHESQTIQRPITLDPRNPVGWHDIPSRTSSGNVTYDRMSDSLFPEACMQQIPSTNITENPDQFMNRTQVSPGLLLGENQSMEFPGFTDVSFRSSNQTVELPLTGPQAPIAGSSSNELLYQFEHWLMDNNSLPVTPNGSIPEPPGFGAEDKLVRWFRAERGDDGWFCAEREALGPKSKNK